ncbi:MAG: hypothetical protein HRU19_05375 [Pseudobacteriovorax sp.]|nr:hypothetical protein [Pseudobacteriovorax sp.]
MNRGIAGYSAVGFGHPRRHLTIASHEELDTKGVFDGKTIILSLRTGHNIEREQVLYEQGGLERGLSLTLSNGKLACQLWNQIDDLLTQFSGQMSHEIDVEAYQNYVFALRYDRALDKFSCY